MNGLTYEKAIEDFRRESCRNCRAGKNHGCGICKVQLAINLISKAMKEAKHA